MRWTLSHRADPNARALSDRHMEKARETFRDWLKRTDYDRRACFEYDELLQEIIATALAEAEREGLRRAAEIAGVIADKHDVLAIDAGSDDLTSIYRRGERAAQQIAAAILSEVDSRP